LLNYAKNLLLSTLIRNFGIGNKSKKMKRTPLILLLVAMMLTLISWNTEGAELKTENNFSLGTSAFYLQTDSTKDSKQKNNSRKTAPQDTSVAYTDTLGEVSVKADKGLRVVDAINKSLNNGLTQPRQKSVTDIIGKKATDYIMHPFAWKERKKEKKHNKDKENLKKYDAITSYEDELTNAINRQLQEDSIAAAKKKEGEKK
jgi:hypothetical protein